MADFLSYSFATNDEYLSMAICNNETYLPGRLWTWVTGSLCQIFNINAIQCGCECLYVWCDSSSSLGKREQNCDSVYKAKLQKKHFPGPKRKDFVFFLLTSNRIKSKWKCVKYEHEKYGNGMIAEILCVWIVTIDFAIWCNLQCDRI